MPGRPITLEMIDDAFAKVLLEELSKRDRGELGETIVAEAEHTASQKWETIAAIEVQEAGSIPLAEPGKRSDRRGRIRPAAPPVEPELLPPIAQAATDAARHWELCITFPDGRGCTLPLEEKPLTLGRDKDNSVVLAFEKVSRRHARIQIDARGPRVDDLGSVNGIQVNGIKVPAAYLKPDDVVMMGNVKVQVRLAD